MSEFEFVQVTFAIILGLGVTECKPSAPMEQNQFWFKGVFLFILT